MTRVIESPSSELWQIVHQWLKLLGNKPNAKFCKEEMTSHPDYPALTAVVDFLDNGNMRYSAVKASASAKDEFNYPLLAHIKESGKQYLYPIRSIEHWDQNSEITKFWSGVVLFPENESIWRNEQNEKYETERIKSKILKISAIGIMITTFIFTAFFQNSLTYLFFGGLSLIGLFISTVLLITELGYQNEIVNQVCGAVSGGGCQKVLNSKYAKGFFGITPADFCVLYFSTQYILFLLSSQFYSFHNCVLLVSIVGVPIFGWSVYTQALKLKQWCALCMAVGGVFLLQFGVFMLMISRGFSLEISDLYALLGFLYFIVFFLIILIPIKALLKSNVTNRTKIAQLKKWKSDLSFFNHLIQKQPTCDYSVSEKDLVIGNPNASIKITAGCNPYCTPCAKAHLQLDRIIEKYGDKVAVQIRLLCDPENDKDEVSIATKEILQKSLEIDDSKKMQEMLSDWFEWMDLEKWKVKWKSSRVDDISYLLRKHQNWMNESKIEFTPTLFINGRKLPGQYSLEELDKIVFQLAQEY